MIRRDQSKFPLSEEIATALLGFVIKTRVLSKPKASALVSSICASARLSGLAKKSVIVLTISWKFSRRR